MTLNVLIQIPRDTEEILMERDREGERQGERGNSLEGKKLTNLNQ